MTEPGGNPELIPGLDREQTDRFMDALFDRRVRGHVEWAVRTVSPQGQVSFTARDDQEHARRWIAMLAELNVGHELGHQVVSRPVVAGAWQAVEASDEP